MPEIKNTFLGGKMNKDLDERLIPKNEYRDALNVEVSTSQGDDVGSLQNTWGNTAHSNISSVIPGAKCIGSIVDRESDKIYWFIHGTYTDAIAEYDLKSRTTSPVLVDFGMEDSYTQTFTSIDVNPNHSGVNITDLQSLPFLNGTAIVNNAGNEGISWEISGGTANAMWGRAGYLHLFRDEVNFEEGGRYEVEFEVISIDADVQSNLMLSQHGPNGTNVPCDIYSTGVKKVQWIQGDNAARENQLVFYFNSIDSTEGFRIDNVKVKEVNRFLNFDTVDHITGINILDGMLFWTDGVNEPKKINIERCKAGSYGVANFGATTFKGPELITNGSFTTDSGWEMNSGHFSITGGVIKTIQPAPLWYGFKQPNVSVKLGKTYLISIDIGGTFTSGKIGPVIIDENGGWTKPRADQQVSTTGTHTWFLTVGVTDDNSWTNLGGNYTPSSVWFQNETGTLNSGITFDNISVKEIAFDWNRTTKVKDATGAYTRNIKEEDITLIKKYPLSAPNMELTNTTKAKGSVIKTSCTTPMNTTSENRTRCFADGSGNVVRYNNFLHTYLRSDVMWLERLPEESSLGHDSMVQFDVGPDWSALAPGDNGVGVDYPVFELADKPDRVEQQLGAPVNIVNDFTAQTDYHKKAWQSWCSLSPKFHNHIWCITEGGGYTGFSSAVTLKDFIGGRLWIKPGTNASVATQEDYWKKGQRIVIGYWAVYNNDSFWTYKDGEGTRLVKPVGASSDSSLLKPDGTTLLDTDDGYGTYLYSPDEKLASAPNDFGGGWTVRDGKYCGDAFTSVGNTYNVNGNWLALNVDATAPDTGYQYLHDFVTNLKVDTSEKSYRLRCTIHVIQDNSPNGYVPIGVSTRNAGPNGAALVAAPVLFNGSTPVTPGIYDFEEGIKTVADLPSGAGLSFYKRDDVVCEIYNIQLEYKSSTQVRLQPLVFEPKPDYEVGDLVKLTNSNKAPNGDDVTVTVKLGNEVIWEESPSKNKSWHYRGANYTSQFANYFSNDDSTAVQAPESWQDGITEGSSDMVNDSNFYVDAATDANLTALSFSGGTTALNSTSANGADWTTSLEMIYDGAMTTDIDLNNDLWDARGGGGFITTGGKIEWIGNNTNWPNITQKSSYHGKTNPRLFFEHNGEYKCSFDYTQTGINTTSGNADQGWRIRLEDSEVFNYDPAFTGDSNVTTPTTTTRTITYDVNNGDVGDRTTYGFNIIGINPQYTPDRTMSGGTLENISCLANDGNNRISWGNSSTQCIVSTGTTSQIIAYPADPTGQKATYDSSAVQHGIFELTGGEYYVIQYEIDNSSYDPDDHEQRATVKLFNHDKIASSMDQGGIGWMTSTNDGHIQLPATDGTHKVYWLQNQTKNQLEIAFGPEFSGNFKNVQVFPVTVSTIDYGTGANKRKIFDFEITSIDNNILQLPLEQHKYWDCELVDSDPLFEKVFPRFAYRWKYEDGEYSAISAFTEVAFLPDEDYRYDAVDGYNLSMENNVRRVLLSGFDKKPNGVVELDILYKESNSTNVYTFTTIKNPELQTFESFEITKEKYHALVESRQMLRPYDNVPRRALSQELSANRIIFGNYTQQYNVSPSDEPDITASLSSKWIRPAEDVSKSIKSIRNYQVGISYLDMFGRQSPVFSTDGALISIDQKNAHHANTITASLNNFPPEWVTHYKYFVKDSAASYYNISLDRIYQAENSNHVWLSFPSSDYNKIKEDDYLVLKKEHNSDKAVSPEKTAKYKVLARRGSAPDFIKMTRKNIGGRIFNSDGKGLEFFSQPGYGGTADGYPQQDKLTFRIKGSIVHDSSNKALYEALIDDQTGRYIRLGQQISNKPSVFSNYHEILHVSRVNHAQDPSATPQTDAYAGEEDYYEFTLVEPLGFDAAFVGTEYKSNRKLFLEYYREEFDEFDSHFQGRFFIKIAKDSDFERYVSGKQHADDVGYNIVNAQNTYWAHCWEDDDTKNTRDDRGEDTDVWLRDRDNFFWGTPHYNGATVTDAYLMANQTLTVNGSTWTNPITATWEGTFLEEDYSESIGSEFPQRFSIFQGLSWSWASTWAGYDGMPSTNNTAMGNGFVMGNNYCSFAFHGVGELDLGDDTQPGGGSLATFPTTNADTNTWADAAEYELSGQWFNNFKLLQQLTKSGTQFKWLDDPSETVYTIEKVMKSAPIKHFHAKLPNGSVYGEDGDGNFLNHDKENYGYRIDLQLNKPIVWSPTATLGSGYGWNNDDSHSTLVPFKSGTDGTTSQIQIIEKRSSELTEASFNPAVFEVEPKERADLNLYYETAKVSMVLKDGMYIEALNNASANDYTNPSSGGNYTTITDIGTIYKPAGQPALPYTSILGVEALSNSQFQTPTTTSATSGVENWTIDSDMTSVHDAVNDTITVSAATNAGDYASLWSDVVTLTDGEEYKLVVDVLELDNDTQLVGGGSAGIKAIIQGWDGSAYTNYYPLPGQWPSLQTGINQWKFTPSSADNAGFSTYKVRIEFTDTTQTYDSMAKLNEVSIKTHFLDETKPITRIKTGRHYDWCDNPNKIAIDHNIWHPQGSSDSDPGSTLPSGVTIRLSERDEFGDTISFKDYELVDDVECDGTQVVVTLPPEKLDWHNCFSFGNGVESNRFRDDFNAVTIDKGPRVSTTLKEAYKEEKRGSGLIFSGMYNSTSSVNELNQFIQAESITKELNPEYGSIQKLFTRNTNIVALCEDKILKVLSNKDALYNADGSMQMTSTTKVLGQAIPFIGEYGISRNPESFANFGYRVYFTDRDRGAVLRLSADGLTPISDKDMISYFKYNLPNANTILGTYDENRDSYNVTLEDTTVSFSEKVNGWTSFKSFLPESGLSLNGEYYTWKNGDIWKHHSNALRNNFYNTQHESSVKFIFNDIVDEVKNFDTLNYEGTTSRIYEDSVGEEDQLVKNGWYTSSISTDLESAKVVNFIDREGKWFNNITGVSKTEEDVDIKDFTSQGLGIVSSVDAGSHPNYKTLYLKAVLPDSIPEVNAIGAGSGIYYNDGAVHFTHPYPVDVTYTEDTQNSTTGFTVESSSQISWAEHTSSETTSNPRYYYVMGVVKGLSPGNRYYIEADIENFSGTDPCGFSSANMVDWYIAGADTRTRSSDGKIFVSFTYDDNKWSSVNQAFGEDGVGIHFHKHHGTSGTVKNIKCINITPKIDDMTHSVNTSSTDRSQAVDVIKTNLEVGSSSAVAKNLYIHSQTIGGLKYAVASSKFTVTTSNPNVTIGTLVDLGSGSSSAGYYDNVIQIPITIDYSTGNLFPDENVESYISVTGVPTLAIDQ